MRDVRPIVAAACAAAFLVTAAGRTSAQDAASGVRSDAPPVVHNPRAFEGLWDYNAEASINIVTGRPEQNPRGAPPPRSFVPPAARGPAAEDGNTGDRETTFSPSAAAMREARDMARDLLEVPETLAFVVTDSDVTITDDLERARTYPTDGRRQRYRLGGSEFSARVRWDGDRLQRDIEGSFGFRISETYFLSPDGDRMFVMVRVGTPSRGRRAPGYDRVYDRVPPAGS